MWRERALKIVFVLVGLLFTAGVYPLIGSLLHPAGSDMGDTRFTRMRTRLHQLGRCFENGEPVSQQRKPYKKRQKGVAIRSYAAAA